MQNSQMTEELAVQQIMETAQRLRSDPAKLDAFRQQLGSRPEVIASIKKLVPRDVVRDTFSVPGEGGSGSGGGIGVIGPEQPPVDNSQKLAEGFMKTLESMRPDPERFKAFRDSTLQSIPALKPALDKVYTPELAQLYLSDSSVDAPEDIQKAPLSQHALSLSQLLKAEQQQPVTSADPNQVTQTSGYAQHIQSALDSTNNAIVTLDKKKANREAAKLSLKKKQDLSYQTKQEENVADFKGTYANALELMPSDASLLEVDADPEALVNSAFAKSGLNRMGNKEAKDVVIEKYLKSNLTDDPEHEKQWKTMEEKASNWITTGVYPTKGGKQIPITPENSDWTITDPARINEVPAGKVPMGILAGVLRESQVVGTPSPFYFKVAAKIAKLKSAAYNNSKYSKEE